MKRRGLDLFPAVSCSVECLGFRVFIEPEGPTNSLRPPADP